MDREQIVEHQAMQMHLEVEAGNIEDAQYILDNFRKEIIPLFNGIHPKYGDLNVLAQKFQELLNEKK